MGWYVVITEGMRALGLSGNDLVVFAVIHGFSQKGAGCYYGGQALLAEICGVSQRTLRDILVRLEDRGLIIKQSLNRNGKSVSAYQIAAEIADDDRQKLPLSPAESADDDRQNPPIDNKVNNKTISNNTLSLDACTRKRFIPPTLEEVTEYIKEKGSPINPNSFHAYYSARGWRTNGNVRLTDWRSAIITWEIRETNSQKPNKNPTPTPPLTRKGNHVLNNMRVLDQLNGTHLTDDYLAQKEKENIDEQ